MRRALVVAALALAGGCAKAPTPTKPQLATAHADVARLRAAAEAFVAAHHKCPTGSDVTLGNDPWGHPYVLLCPGQKGHAADVVSKGADGDLATADDIRSWD